MINSKKTGSYYTPSTLTDFLVKHIFSNYLSPDSHLRILEPSCGDGQFVSSLNRNVLGYLPNCEIHLVDINKAELGKALNTVSGHSRQSISSHAVDYLSFDIGKFSLILGNPPYIHKVHLSKQQIEACERICRNVIPDLGEVKNIWSAFLLKAASELTDDGILCFVLPSEILQVNYTKKIREYLLNRFQRIEVFTFNELIFPNVEQDVVVLIGTKKIKDVQKKGVAFYHVNKLEDLKIPGYIEKYSNVHRKRLEKWTNYILQDDELNLVEELTNRLNLKRIISYCQKVEVGIVTAANNYFIVNSETIKEYKLSSIAKPVVNRAPQACGLNLTTSKYTSLKRSNKPVFLLHFPNVSKSHLPHNNQKYINAGIEQEIHERYKMKKRENWYHVPAVWLSDGMFIKRSHLYPKVIVNKANVYVTDSFYRIKMKPEYNIEHLAFSFYNSLTFVLAELEGRYYGGGVLELTPNEFKNLYIPYKEISTEQYGELNKILQKEKSAERALRFTDRILLKELSEEEREQVSTIRKKLVNRRLKKNNER